MKAKWDSKQNFCGFSNMWKINLWTSKYELYFFLNWWWNLIYRQSVRAETWLNKLSSIKKKYEDFTKSILQWMFHSKYIRELWVYFSFWKSIVFLTDNMFKLYNVVVTRYLFSLIQHATKWSSQKPIKFVGVSSYKHA